MVQPLLDGNGIMKILAAAAVLAATTGTGLAQPVLAPPSLTPPSLTEPVPQPTETQWYGWQILLADGATFALAAGTEHGEIALGWIGTGAAVHAAHDNYGRAVLSVGMRIGLPILGASLGASSAQGCQGDFCDLGAILLGGMVGMGTAEVIDLVLAKDERPIAPAKLSKGWTPVASVRHSGATFGIAARF